MDEIKPWDILFQVIHSWLIVFVFGILGALLGYGFSLRNPPLYEAMAVMSFGLNFDREPPFRQREQDLAEGKIVGYLSSDEVLQTALDNFVPPLSTNNHITSISEFKSQIRLVRRISQWELTVTNQDPYLAAELANAWAVSAERNFWEAYAHALRAVDLQTQLDQIQSELANLKAESSQDPNIKESIKQLEDVSADLESELQTDLTLSHGVVSFISFEFTNRASVPAEPVTHGVGSIILSGNLLGILAGLILSFVIQLRPIRSWIKSLGSFVQKPISHDKGSGGGT